MKASELIEKLAELKAKYGDVKVEFTDEGITYMVTDVYLQPSWGGKEPRFAIS